MSISPTLTVKMFVKVLICSFSDKRCILCAEQDTCAFIKWHEELKESRKRKEEQ